ncbi:MAG: tetratricopeptide repeat protein [Candidatus Tectomicrobia bacterium]|uniref:Tetratricopeptide repeat protein n=1 Tax=Tectimicrobiota bacterium TaxID=2528274 RepID=A0A938B1W8_UNCTE|nr:tetratricopeptide repeat protein [Candidatus Tectomicrobia bacterium]
MRRESPPSRPLTPLVGREAEIAILLERWNQVKAGFGQVVLLRGEAGIGKSRLVAAVCAKIAQEPHVCLEGRCAPYDQHVAWSPLTTALQRFLDWCPHVSPATQCIALEQVAQQYGLPLATTVPGLVLLLGSTRTAAPDDLPPLDPQHQRQQILLALLALLTAVARQQPLVFILEDVHWSDPSTLELLERLVDAGPTAAIYTIVTCRPPWQPAWISRAHVTPLVVPRLSPTQAATLVTRVAGSATVPTEVLHHLVQQTDGVPLFLEELTKTVLESDTVPQLAGLPLPIPTTLHDSLMARLDRLDTAKRLVQVGSIIGREFSYTLLQALTALEDTTLQRDLAQLVAAELVYQQGLPPQATYVFKHALIRDVAYQSMLQRTRQQLHARLVRVCTEGAPPAAVLPPALLAHHATQAELLPQALVYWQQAGAHALQQGAYHEALRHVQQGFALLDHLPAGPARLRHETELSLALTPILLILHGAGSPEVERLTSRAYALSQQLEQSPTLFPALRGLHYVAWTQGQLQTAQELAERLLALAQRSTDAVWQMEAHLAMGTTLWYHGQCVPALQHLEQGLSVRDPRQQLTVQRVPHPELGCLLYSALVLWYLGYPEQAERRMQEGLACAAQMTQPHHLVWAQHLGALFYRLGRQLPQAQALTETAVQAATAQGMTFAVAGGHLLQEWAHPDHLLAPFAQYQARLTAYRARNGPLGLAQHLVWLAEAYGQCGQPSEGLHALAEAQHLVAYTGEQLVRAEMLRVQGELLAAAGATCAPPGITAENVLQHALTLARQQQATMLELRAAVSLSRLWQQQGQRARAHEVLGTVYACCTEGLNTVDLQEARALLGGSRATLAACAKYRATEAAWMMTSRAMQTVGGVAYTGSIRWNVCGVLSALPR